MPVPGHATEAPPRPGWRDRIRSKPGLREAYRIAVFLVGLLFIVGGFALVVFPGPLTIPPLLIGLFIWSTEFGFAERLFDKFKIKADQAWDHAREHKVSSAAVTLGGLAVAGAAVWAVDHFELIDRAKIVVS